MSNPILEYFKKIECGEEVVGRKVKVLYSYIVNNLFNSKKYEYREDLANYAIDFIENYCRHSKGRAGGKPFILELWQKALICTMFGFVKKGTTLRKYKIVHLIIGRKNGKSTLAAAISLYMLIADGESGPEVYAVATKKDQAKIIWKEAVKMIKKSPNLRALAKPKVGEIVSDFNEGEYKALGRDSDSLDGLNVSGASMDEIEAWRDMNMYDVIVDATSARDNWLVFLTSTAGPVRESVWDTFYEDGRQQINSLTRGEELDESTLYVFYELDKKEEWKDKKCWKKANPGLGTIKNEEELERKVNAALRDSAKVRNLVMKDFNIPDTNVTAWLNLEDIQKKDAEGNVIIRDFKLASEFPNDGDVIKPLYFIGGIDLSITTDLTCATAIFMLPSDNRIYVKQMYWIPEDLLDDHERTDKVPYKIWNERGLLRTCSGNKIRIEDVYDWFVELQEEHDIYAWKIGYDGYSMAQLTDKLKLRFGEQVPEPVYQGVKTLSGPMYALGADIKSKRLVYGDNPILEWCMTNVTKFEDNNGNIKPIKDQHPTRRIDGFASLLDAYVKLLEYYEEYQSII